MTYGVLGTTSSRMPATPARTTEIGKFSEALDSFDQSASDSIGGPWIVARVKTIGSHVLPERERLVQELLQNATDAIVVRASKDPGFRLQDGRIVVRTSPASSRFEITDNGIGVTPEQVELAVSLLAPSKVSELKEATRAATLDEESSSTTRPFRVNRRANPIARRRR